MITKEKNHNIQQENEQDLQQEENEAAGTEGEFNELNPMVSKAAAHHFEFKKGQRC